VQFINNAPLYKVIRITGPKHNMLGIQFSESPMTSPPIVEALNAEPHASVKLAAGDVVEQVTQGVRLAEQEFGREYHVEKIQFVTTDTPPASVYKDLAIELIRRMEGGG
jgi:hypothetical protein